MKVSDEVVEAACRAFYGERWLAMTESMKEAPRRWQRAALEAALPLVLGEPVATIGADGDGDMKVTVHKALPVGTKLYTRPAPQPEGGVTEARALLERAEPLLRDAAEPYEDDGSNEPLELARDIAEFLAAAGPVERPVSSASAGFDGPAVAALAARQEK